MSADPLTVAARYVEIGRPELALGLGVAALLALGLWA